MYGIMLMDCAAMTGATIVFLMERFELGECLRLIQEKRITLIDRRYANMDIQNLVAIDVHTHAEVSQRIPDDPLWQAIQEASADYFKDEGPRLTIPEIAAYYRERKMACVIFLSRL
jgi:hypothetical protein